MKRHFYKQLKFFLFLSLMSFITLSNSLFAQDKGEIKGRVTNAVTGEELIGANVFIPALNTGASTDVNGYFTIKNISPGTYVLTAQYVGYSKKTYEIIVRTNSTTQQDFALDPTSVQMDEVVVTGQGTATEKRKLTTTIETINTEEIRNAPVESVDQLLQGRVTGLESFNSSGLPGTSGRITTRGVKSSNTSTTPVIYVDGVRVDNSSAYRIGVDMGGNEMSALSDLIVGEIDRIEVIKGGAASTIYGSEAANGVIQIFTKKGIPGPPKWTFNVTSGYDKPEEKFIMEDVTKQLVMHAGRFQSYSLGVQGGSKDFTYSFNGKILENLGIIIHDNAMNRQYSLSSGFRVLFSEKTNLDMSASYVKTKNWGVQSNNTIMAPYSLAEVYDWIWYTDPSDVTWEDTLNTLRNMFENYSMAQELVDDVDRFRLAANFEYKPFENFINRFTFGVDYRRNEQRNLIPKHAGDFWYNPNGYLERYDRAYATWTLGYSGSYKLPELGPVAQTITFGAQGFRVEDRQGYMFGDQFNIPGTDDIGNTATQTSDESNQELFNGGFYLTDQIGFWDRVFVDLGFRVDANSTFGDNVDLVFYPKVGIAYNVSDESFYPAELKPIISTFKLRAAVGQTGNFPAPFTRDRTYSALQFLGSSGIGFANPGNDDIGPERTTSFDAGFDMGLFDDKAFIEFNYFNQVTKDALFSVPRDPASGWGNLQLTNVGEIVNRGIELALNAQVIQTTNFTASIRASYSTLHNEVTDLGGAAPFDLAGFTPFPRRVEEGYPVGVFRVGVPLKDADGNYTGEWENQLKGTPLPTDFGSIALNIVLFQDFTISGLLEYAFGHDILNLKQILRYFNDAPKTAEYIPEGYSWTQASYHFLEKGDWIKLREISLTYRVPESIIKYFGNTITGASFNFSVRNVLAFGQYCGNDPESNGYQPSGPATGGYAYADPSAPRQFRFGLNLNF